MEYVRAVDDENARADFVDRLDDGRGAAVEPLQHPLQQVHRQSNTRFAVAGVGKGQAGQLPQRGDGDVAAEDLQQEEADGDQRREDAVAPEVVLEDELLLQRPREGKIRQWIASQPGERAGNGGIENLSHPWPPVQGVFSKHHCDRRLRFAQM